MKLTRRSLIKAQALAGTAVAAGVAIPRAEAFVRSTQDGAYVEDQCVVLKDSFNEVQDTALRLHVSNTGDTWRRHSGWPGGASVIGGAAQVQNFSNAQAVFISSATTTPVGHVSIPYTLDSVANNNVSIMLFVPDAVVRGGYQIRANSRANVVHIRFHEAGANTLIAVWPHSFVEGDHVLTAGWSLVDDRLSITVVVDGDVVGTHSLAPASQSVGFTGLALTAGASLRQICASGAALALPPVYVDPSYVGPEVGTYAQPYSTWASALPLQDNRTYLIRSGTVLREEVTIKNANGVTVDVYDGTDMAIVDGEDVRDRCVVYGSCDDLVIRRLHATRGGKYGFLMENGDIRDYGPILVEDCRADFVTRDSGNTGEGVGFQLKNINNVKTSLLTVRRVTCEQNGRMGFDQQRWGGTAEYYDVVARFNGSLAPGGGFFTHPWRLGRTGPWVNVGDQLWEWALPSARDDPGYVVDQLDDPYGKPLAPTSNPAPAAGEFYHDAANRRLVINLHDPSGDPNVRGVRIARSTIHVLVDGAEVAFNGSPAQDIDATGFQFDDFSHNVVGRNIHSHDNQGAGIACHQTYNALIEDSVAEFNAQDQVRNHIWYGNFSATGAAVATWRNITARGDGASIIRAVTVGRDCVLTINGLTSEGHSETFYMRQRGTVNLVPAVASIGDATVLDLDRDSVVLGEEFLTAT